MQSFATADIDNVRIRNRNRDRAYRSSRLIVENRLPCPAVIGRFENAAVDLRKIKNVRLRWDAADGTHASTTKRPDVSPAQHRGKILLGLGDECAEKESEHNRRASSQPHL